MNIEFKDTKSFDSEELYLLLSVREGIFLRPEKLQEDVRFIKKYYFDRGFFNAKVDTACEYMPGQDEGMDNDGNVAENDNEVNIRFLITENVRSKIESIEYSGLDDVSPAAKKEIYKGEKKIKIDAGYSRENVNAETQRVIAALKNNGYAFAFKSQTGVVRKLSFKDSIEEKVLLKLGFSPGRIYNFGGTKIEITGKSYSLTTADFERDIMYKQGEIYDESKRSETESRIKNFPLVENCTFEPDTLNEKGEINFTVKIRLKNKYELKPELAGFELNNVLYGGAGLEFSDRNFFGTGRTFKASFLMLYHSAKDNIFQLETNVIQPYLFNDLNTTGTLQLAGVFTTAQLYQLLASSVSLSAKHNYGAGSYLSSIEAGIEGADLNFSTREQLLVEDEETGVLIDPFNINILLLELKLALSHSSVDDILYPASGFQQSLEMRESGLLSGLVKKFADFETAKFFKAVFSNKFFYNISGKGLNSSVLGVKLNTGVIFDYGENELENINFTHGGASSNRGWRSRGLGIVENEENGGKFLLEGSLEHRIRSFGDYIGYIKDLGFVTFLDLGNVWKTVKKFRFDEVALSMGAGIRYFTKVGAVRLDLGFKLYDPEPGPLGGTKWLFQRNAVLKDKFHIQIGIGNTF